MRVCLMGDSHLAAIRRGWTLIQDDFTGFELTFFAGARPEWETMSVCGASLVPASDKLSEQFRISARGLAAIGPSFDLYVVCGLELVFTRYLKAWTSGDHREWDELRSHVARKLRMTLAAKVMSQLREITTGRIALMADPFQPEIFCAAASGLDVEIADRIRSIYVEECDRLAAERGGFYVPQPPQTIADNRVTTRMDYAQFSVDPSVEDRRHANAAYGALILSAALTSAAEIP